LIQGLVFHPRHESGRCVGVPLEVHHGFASGIGDSESEIKPADTGKQRGGT
jgi:hypothetical protein